MRITKGLVKSVVELIQEHVEIEVIQVLRAETLRREGAQPLYKQTVKLKWRD